VADAPRGPGWTLAPDGKWYPQGDWGLASPVAPLGTSYRESLSGAPQVNCTATGYAVTPVTAGWTKASGQS
jgi:hypothetical protein